MRYDLTEEWEQYQAGLDYNNRIDYYAKTDLNWRFYNGKQWEGITANGLPTPVFNIARSAINYFIASIMSQKIKMQYTVENIPDEPADPVEQQQKEFADLLSGYADLKWEKEKMDSKLRQLLLDGANSGDFCAYVYWDPQKKTGQAEQGDFVTELVDGVNVMFGNPNNPSVEAQPYILIIGREMVNSLKKEAKDNKISSDLINSITSDSEYNYQAGDYGKYELDKQNDVGKCLYLIRFWKKDGIVFWNKSTKYCPIRKDVELGIGRYPVAFGNWEKVKNSYHGMPVMTGIIPNQIIINQLFAMVAYWMRMAAFGKVLYDSNKIEAWTNKIGTAIPVQGEVDSVVYQLQAGNFNHGVLEVIDIAIKYTKDFIGASDAALGQVKPDNTSAIIAVQKAATIPLENVQANLYQFVEDLALIWGEFILNKYVSRKIGYKQNGQILTANIDTEPFKDILLNCNIDVGPSTYWSEIMSMQTLDSLLNSEKITMIQYLERIPNGIIPKKQELLEELKKLEEQAQMMEQQNAEYEQMAQFVESLPEEQQAQLEQLRQTNPQQYEVIVRQMIGGGQPPPAQVV